MYDKLDSIAVGMSRCLLKVVSALALFASVNTTTVADEPSAAKWRSSQLEVINEKLQSVDSEETRLELLAQRTWLRRWEPGEMSKMPTSSSATEDDDEKGDRELVEEPLLANLKRPEGVAKQEWQRLIALQAGLRQIDTNEERKENLREIIPASQRFVDALSEALVPSARPHATPVEQLNTDRDWVLAYARYRLGRALAYREIPVVRERWPIEDPVAYQRRLYEVYRQLNEQTGGPRAEFILLEDRMLRRSGEKGLALELLEKHQGSIDVKWYLKKRRDLLQELGWEPPYREAAKIYFDAGYRDDP
ncbi:hypothetical protein [Rhodopirellula sallentina]|uniref:Signal peptide protein n=1 Tax=Rhodopirellula sallentina SM41 TaxID=1263870 RepID=M5TZV6_9BACT|nr:hypothetical protein [Rhodopirellula sallentina]EMI54742.1 signal peptide protein [Rhodopirellula sallentina SM41]